MRSFHEFLLIDSLLNASDARPRGDTQPVLVSPIATIARSKDEGNAGLKSLVPEKSKHKNDPWRRRPGVTFHRDNV
jgi:hypothetical protein